MSPDTQWSVVVAATIVLAVVWVAIRLRRWLARSRTPRIHPKLSRYQQSPDIARLRAEQAEKILATSSTATIAGYRLVRQIEAVFVDGFRRPEEAIEGLKSACAMKGANAVINVAHEPSSMGRYRASGDAVLIEPDAAPGEPQGPDAP